jgi:hypothetical protein
MYITMYINMNMEMSIDMYYIDTNRTQTVFRKGVFKDVKILTTSSQVLSS